LLFRALVVCSDEDCEAEFEVIAPLEEIEALACDCGHGMQVIRWPEPVELAHARSGP
jgi:hypothetical protein